MVYKAVWWRRLDELGLVVLFAGLLAATISTATSGNTNIYWLTPLWLVMLSISLYLFFFAIFEIRIDQDSLGLRSLIYRKTLNSSEINSIDIIVAAKSSQISIFDQAGKERVIALRSFDDPTALANEVKQWWDSHRVPTSDLDLIATFRARGFAWMATTVGAFLTIPFIGLPLLDERNRPMLGFSAPFSILLLVFFASTFRFSLTISPEGMLVRQLRGLKRVPWDSITKVRLSNRSSKGSTNEIIAIEWGEKTLYLNQVWDHFPRIRDLILTHVSPNLVADERRKL